jgi:hypothetical protein
MPAAGDIPGGPARYAVCRLAGSTGQYHVVADSNGFLFDSCSEGRIVKTLCKLFAMLLLTGCAASERDATQPAQDPAALSVALTEHLDNVRQRYGPGLKESLPTFQVTGIGGAMTEADIVALLESKGYTFAGKGQNGKLRVKVPSDRIPLDPETGKPVACFSADADLNPIPARSAAIRPNMLLRVAAMFRPTPLHAATVQGCGCDSQCWIDGWVGTCYLDTICGQTQVCAFVICEAGVLPDPAVPAQPGEEWEVYAYDCQPW